jgi:hypothetical protein
VLGAADRIVVVASADPEGAARLVEWKAAAEAAGVSAPSVGVFGRARSNLYERDHLARVVQANTGRRSFSSLSFLPEDQTVARARWNAEMVWRCPWVKAVKEVVAASGAASAGGVGGEGRHGWYEAARGYAGPTSAEAAGI